MVKSRRVRRVVFGFFTFSLFGLLFSGCPKSRRPTGKVEDGRHEKDKSASSVQGPLCVVEMEKVINESRECSKFKEVWKKVEKEKKRLQDELNLLITAYKRTYERDLEAAKYIQDLEKLKKEKGSVLSEKDYEKRLSGMQKVLDNNPDLARAVKEQLEETESYKERKKAAKKDALEIEERGKKLQQELQKVAREIAAPVTKQIREVIGKSLENRLESDCGIICDLNSGKVVAHRGSVQEAVEHCRKFHLSRRPSVKGGSASKGPEGENSVQPAVITVKVIKDVKGALEDGEGK